jgi:hypothetical protein
MVVMEQRTMLTPDPRQKLSTDRVSVLYLDTQLLLIAALPALKALVQVASQAWLELQAEVLGSVCNAKQLNDTINPAVYTCHASYFAALLPGQNSGKSASPE